MSKIKLGLPSKGRLKEESIKLFLSKNLSIQNSNSRNYFFNFEESSSFDGIFLHAREIIERLNDGTLDAGVSGLDLLLELPDEFQKNIKILKKLNFGYFVATRNLRLYLSLNSKLTSSKSAIF